MVASKQPSGESFLTLEEFLRLPETEPASEYANGRAVQKVSPKAKHSRLQYKLSEHLNRRLNPVYYAFPELRCTFGGRSPVPDVALFRTDRLPRDESGEPADDVFVAPDAAVEVRSPTQSATDLVEKLAFCVENGVQLGLLVDPIARRVVLFRRGDYPEEIADTGVIDGGQLIPGLHLAVSEMWGWLKM